MSSRITSSMLLRTALVDVNRQRTRLAVAQEQASSGLRINRPSDNPVGASAAVLLRAGLQATERFEQNLSATQVRVRTLEAAVADATDVLSRARELAINGANETHDANSRKLLAAEVEGLHGFLLSQANSSISGGYVFAGFTSDTPPFAVSGPFVDGLPSPSVTFVGDSNEIEVAIDDGITVKASLDGRRVFLGDADGDGSPDAGREDLFDALASLRDALMADDTAAIGTALGRLEQASSQLETERAKIGTIDAKLSTWETRLASRRVDLATRLSDTQDADATQVYSDLVQEEMALQASLEATSRLLQPSLLDFLS